MTEFIPGTNIKIPRQTIFPKKFTSKNTLVRYGNLPFLLNVSNEMPYKVDFASGSTTPSTKAEPVTAGDVTPEAEADSDVVPRRQKPAILASYRPSTLSAKPNEAQRAGKTIAKADGNRRILQPASVPSTFHMGNALVKAQTEAKLSETVTPLAESDDNQSISQPASVPSTSDNAPVETEIEIMPYFPKQTIKSSRYLKCIYCPQVFLAWHIYAVHLKNHEFNITDNGDFLCECGEMRNSLQSIDRHIRSAHPELSCHLCKRLFAKTSLLQRHMDGHAKAVLEECVICHRCYEFGSPLKAHMRSHYGEVKLVNGKYVALEYKCSYCSETRTAKWLLDEHMRSHAGDGSKVSPFTCEYCGKEVRRLHSLREHIQRRHINERHTCGVCGRIYSSKFALKEHMERIHGKNAHRRKVRRFICSLCNGKYHSKRGRDMHFRSAHLSIRDYVCKVCGADFGYLTSFNKHMLIHEEGRPYKLMKRWHRKTTIVLNNANNDDE